LIRFALLGSGSSGNAILVVAGGSKILIDNGLSFKQLQLRAAEVGESLDDLKAVFITHEHSDHVHGLPVMSKRLDVPIYMTPGTAGNLPVRARDIPNIHFFESGETIPFNGVTLHSFQVEHDAAEPVSYVVECDGARLGIAADLGCVSKVVQRRLTGSHGLVLESNYCPDMLRVSKYPPAIRQRIHGRQGHLSNIDACKLLASLIHDRLQLVVLVHISEENNTYETAVRMATDAMRASKARICCAQHGRTTEMFQIQP
jgi:phosphoribosyl 1,2-cyclic phosphodiesterase